MTSCVTSDSFLLPVRSGEYQVKRTLMETYDRTSRPVRNDTSSVNVNVAISLYQILDTVSAALLPDNKSKQGETLGL